MPRYGSPVRTESAGPQGVSLATWMASSLPSATSTGATDLAVARMTEYLAGQP